VPRSVETLLRNLVVEDSRGKYNSVKLSYLMFELYILMVQLVGILVFFVSTSSTLDVNCAAVSSLEFGIAALGF
jgi:hypothetical protein